MIYLPKTALVTSLGDGPALTAAAAASCLQAQCKKQIAADTFRVGDVIYVEWQGRISCVVTTPGTARFDLRMGSTVVWDSGAINLNTTAKTNVPFTLSGNLYVRQVISGTTAAAALLGILTFESEAIVGSPANTAGGNASLNVPVGAPAVGNTWDSSAPQTLDSYFTQTVATGSMTLHNFGLWFAT